MDSSDLSVLVARLERESDHAPGIYTAKVALVAALGYALIGVFVLGILVSLYSVIATLLSEGRVYRAGVAGCVAGIALLVPIIRGLWVQIDAPEGREIVREDAPALFAAIDDVLQRMATKKGGKLVTVSIDAVTLDREFDIGVVRLPRWGLFGNCRNHLRIGVPVIAALNIAELKAMFAHEIAHLGAEQTRFAAWIYRQRIFWRILQQKFAEPFDAWDRILGMFYGRYARYFRAYTLVLARNHEFAADLAAAQATNAGVLARALTKFELAGRFLAEVFWTRLFDQVEKAAEPQYLPYSMMPRAFAVAQKEWLRLDWLQGSLSRFPGLDDTHPALGERLAALGIKAEVPAYTPDKSALSLLGAGAAPVLKWCDDEWHQENAAAWRKRHDAITEARWKIAQYQNTPPGDLKSEDLWEKALLLLDLGCEDDAIEELISLVAKDPSLAKAHLLLGKLLLQHGDEHGLQSLVLAAHHDVELLETSGQLGYSYLSQRGRKGEAQRFWERVRAA